ncbi:TPA: hypothetical protein ACQQP6_004747 [Salmonella enterica subsp. enterica]|uniref:DUF7352 domain-containing protein n=1 Tax=Salmonella enterica subsp. enterica serovar Stanley TaxID=192953 RepID=A0A626INX6_SALET|nr:hypothetical protein [Escherichia coli]EAB9678605.1 hypothetical protein [Salmonella enterica subsp. enterica serovar Agona]EAV4564945.1 hypothetical protein [Salmonella enterica]EBG0049917.1 hypothetical protein [Salmonella enterica subsp. enterica serovar Stanley]EBG0324180.1 hypothetical protein [Salmonella enterica subsp. enterica serovar Infantis]EBW1918418.1 hypothetical protein [Salmonella enterica subsp. enterica serovar Newport]EBX3015956.1 hypothetical protein [Salmonella enteric
MNNFGLALPWFFTLFVTVCIVLFANNYSKAKKRSPKNKMKSNTISTDAGVILKYELNPSNMTVLMLPESAQILTVKGGQDHVYLWAVVPEGKENVKRSFMVIPTGEGVVDNSIYIGTAYVEKMVFHVFEVIK